jgi:hypothetical protein
MMKRIISVITGVALALSVCIGCPVNTVEAGPVTSANAAYETSENPFNFQDDQAVEYDRRRWIQPAEWNCPKIDPNDYTGGIMLYFDKIGIAPENAPGAVQRVYFSITGATEPVSQIKFHFYYDTRLTVVQNNNKAYITAGSGLSGFTTGSAMVEEGQLVFYAYSPEDILLGNSCIFTVDFKYPDDAEQGEIYPFGLVYTVDDVAADTFIGSQQDDSGRLQMTYVFTKGIYNGYIKINGEKKTTPPVEYDLGDVNNDDRIDAVDASSVLSYYAKISTDQDGGYTEAQKLAADVNNDGLINAVDASDILAYYAYASASNEEAMPIEEYLKNKYPNL